MGRTNVPEESRANDGDGPVEGICMRVNRLVSGTTRTVAAAFLGATIAGMTYGGMHLNLAATSTGDRAIFQPLTPARILDTRTGVGTVGASTAPIAAGGAIDLQVGGAGGVPADAVAVVMNVTYTKATKTGFITVWPSGETRPNASNLNTVAGATAPNLVTVKLGAGGRVSIYNSAGTVHVLADVAGYYIAHDHDDRYYTKTEVDAAVATAKDDRWAYVISSGSLHASSGGITATHPATGQYWVIVPKRGSYKAAQATLADPGGTAIISVGTGHGSACNPLSTATDDAIPVYAMTPAGAAVDANFTIVVPAP